MSIQGHQPHWDIFWTISKSLIYTQKITPGSTCQMNGVNEIIDMINCYKRKLREIAMALCYNFKLGMQDNSKGVMRFCFIIMSVLFCRKYRSDTACSFSILKPLSNTAFSAGSNLRKSKRNTVIKNSRYDFFYP